MSCNMCKQNFIIVNKKHGLCQVCNHKRLHPDKDTSEGSKYAIRRTISIKTYKPLKRTKIVSTKKTKDKRKALLQLDHETYLKVFNSRPHYCEECKKPLPATFKDNEGNINAIWQYSHIISKGSSPEFRHNPYNFNRLCFEHHQQWEFGDRKSMNIYNTNQLIINKIRELKIVMERIQTSIDFDIIVKQQKKSDNTKIIEKLLKLSESLLNQSNKVNTEITGNWTNRRQQFANNAQYKKDDLLKKSLFFSNLANSWKEDRCPEILRNIRTTKDLDTYYPRPVEEFDGWYKDSYPSLKAKADKMGIKNKEDSDLFRNTIKELSEIKLSEKEIKERELKEELKKVHTYNIPGFFPTPDDVIQQMLDYADIQDYTRILEPSAGIGSICDMITKNYPTCEITCCEKQSSLSWILQLKGYNVVANDIFDMVKVYEFQRIIMNPPFENGQDIDHVKFCYDKFLKYDGRLVSVMSAGVKSNTKQKYVDFREWVNEKGGELIDLGQAFKTAFNSTGVSTVLLIINK